MINPQQIINNIFQSNIQNPVAKSMLSAYQRHDLNGMEQIARNVLREQGRNYDEELTQIKNRLGIR